MSADQSVSDVTARAAWESVRVLREACPEVLYIAPGEGKTAAKWRRPTDEAAQAALADPGVLGLIPGSLGLAGIDFDKWKAEHGAKGEPEWRDPEEAASELTDSLPGGSWTVHPSQSGAGRHLLVRSPEGPRAWVKGCEPRPGFAGHTGLMVHGCRADLRGDTGILWTPAAAWPEVAALALSEAPGHDLAPRIEDWVAERAAARHEARARSKARSAARRSGAIPTKTEGYAGYIEARVESGEPRHDVLVSVVMSAVGRRHDRETVKRECFRAAPLRTADPERRAALEREFAAAWESAAKKPASTERAKLDANEVAEKLAIEESARWAYTHGRGWLHRESDEGLWSDDPGSLALRARVSAMISAGQTKRGLRAGEAAAAAEPLLRVPLEEWDADRMTVGLPCGRVLDLGGSEPRSRPATGDDRVTRRLGVDPTRDEPGRFLAFLAEVMPSPEDVAYLRSWLKNALTGDCRHQAILALFGVPGSGKTTLMTTLREVWGEYAATIAAERFTEQAMGAHRQWLFEVVSSRLCLVTDMPERARFNQADLNAIADGDRITLNLMRQNDITLTSTAHVILAGNHRPRVSPGSGLLRRMKIIGFMRKPKAVDAKLPTALAAEKAAILGWILTAPTRADELAPETDGMEAARASYEVDHDRLAGWRADRLIEREGLKTRHKELRDSYVDWAGEQGEKEPVSAQAFSKAATDRWGPARDDQGRAPKRNVGRAWRHGVAIRGVESREPVSPGWPGDDEIAKQVADHGF